jgi:hypothetical protein
VYSVLKTQIDVESSYADPKMLLVYFSGSQNVEKSEDIFRSLEGQLQLMSNQLYQFFGWALVLIVKSTFSSLVFFKSKLEIKINWNFTLSWTVIWQENQQVYPVVWYQSDFRATVEAHLARNMQTCPSDRRWKLTYRISWSFVWRSPLLQDQSYICRHDATQISTY